MLGVGTLWHFGTPTTYLWLNGKCLIPSKNSGQGAFLFNAFLPGLNSKGLEYFGIC